MERAASKVKQLARTQGRTFTWLAKQIGIDRTLFEHIESGRRRAPEGYYQSIAAALGVPIDWVTPDDYVAPAHSPAESLRRSVDKTRMQLERSKALIEKAHKTLNSAAS